MTNTVVRLALTTLAFTAVLVGCKPLEKNSSLRDSVMKEPDPAFLKRVKNDPFPAAGQAPKPATDSSSIGTASDTSRSEALATPAPRSGVLGQSNVRAGVSGSSLNGGTSAAAAVSSSAATAMASDDETTTTPSTAASTAPLTARNNVRPLRRAPNGTVRQN